MNFTISVPSYGKVVLKPLVMGWFVCSSLFFSWFVSCFCSSLPTNFRKDEVAAAEGGGSKEFISLVLHCRSPQPECPGWKDGFRKCAGGECTVRSEQSEHIEDWPLMGQGLNIVLW